MTDESQGHSTAQSLYPRLLPHVAQILSASLASHPTVSILVYRSPYATPPAPTDDYLHHKGPVAAVTGAVARAAPDAAVAVE